MNSGQKREFLQETNFQELEVDQDQQVDPRKKKVLDKYPQWNQENQQNN